MMDVLEARGQLANTLVIYTADNGMPFVFSKAFPYGHGTHVPLAIRWPAGGVVAGRLVTDFVNLIDVTKTVVDATGVCVTVQPPTPCVLPFVYNGVTYTACTTAGDNLAAWCSTAVGVNREYENDDNWNYCDPLSCRLGVFTADLPPRQCVFPFNYSGSTYDACTVAGRHWPWCATRVNATGDMTAWSYCGAQFDGSSIMDSLISTQSGLINSSRTFLVNGLEQHDAFQPVSSRTVVTADAVYVQWQNQAQLIKPIPFPLSVYPTPDPSEVSVLDEWICTNDSFSWLWNFYPNPVADAVTSRFLSELPPEELFDLTTDPGAFTNLLPLSQGSSYQSQLDYMRGLLRTEQLRVQDYRLVHLQDQYTYTPLKPPYLWTSAQGVDVNTTTRNCSQAWVVQAVEWGCPCPPELGYDHTFHSQCLINGQVDTCDPFRGDTDSPCHGCENWCPGGQYITSICTPTDFRTCADCCQPGFWTNQNAVGQCTPTTTCIPCSTTCPAGQYIGVPCNSSQDITCKGCDRACLTCIGGTSTIAQPAQLGTT